MSAHTSELSRDLHPSVTLRAGQPLDAGQVGAILSDWVDTTPWMPRVHTRAQDVAHAATLVSRGWVTIAESPTGVVGFLARDAERIQALYLSGSARRQGIGSLLLQDAKARSARLELWTFAQNAQAQAFYEQAGFTAVERTNGADNDEGLPDIRYQWERTAL